jgi:AcrR family transcriptional regulator
MNQNQEGQRNRGGRRKGESSTREDILAAAANQFAELGYDRATLRSIAAEAAVDQKLIAHFFGNKQQLFIASVGLPINPAELLSTIIAGDRETIGDRITDVIVSILETPEIHQKMAGLIRAASAEPEAARMVREFLTREVFGPAAQKLAIDHAELRVNLVGSQIVGLMTARYIVGVEPLASASPRLVAAVIGETLSRYLLDPLPEVRG